MVYFYLVLLTLNIWLKSSSTYTLTGKQFHPKQRDDFFLQRFEVVTDDNYILGLYHLLGRQVNASTIHKPVVLLMHGLLSSHYDWMMLGEKSLPYMLHDVGYDVWMGNSRGNAYSKRHMAWSTDTSLFWDFSWHEMGVYDLPALIDFVLNVTRQEKLFYVGHSQGTVQFYVLTAERPEYNDKITAMHGLAPVSFLSHIHSPLAPILSQNMEKAQDFFKRIGLHQLTGTPKLLRASGVEPNDICGDESPMQNVCACVIYLICGFDTDQFNKSIIPKIMLTTSAGASLKQVAHFLQLYKSHKFRKFDYGAEANLQRYGQLEPPNYLLRNVKAPVYLHYSLNDWLSSPIDVRRLASHISKCVAMIQIPHPRWSHVDFVYGRDADAYVYRPLIKLLDQDLKKG